MADISWDDVVLLAQAPELDGDAVDPALQTVLLDYVNHEALNPRVYKGESSSTYKLARAYLAAHMASLITPNNAGAGGGAGGGATAGAVTSESEGGLSRSYAQASDLPGASDSSYGSTVYGVKLAGLKTLARLPFLIGGPR